MAHAYLIALYREPASEENLAKYASLARTAIESKGGKFIARGLPVKTFEIGQTERSVIIEFESAEAAINAYESEAYQEALSNLGVLRDMRVVEAV